MHQYKNLEKDPFWEIISKALVDLEKNQDLILQTKKEYVCGYILNQIKKEKITGQKLNHIKGRQKIGNKI